MDMIVRAVDVGSGNTKYVTGVVGSDIRCASFRSLAYPSSLDTSALPGADRCKTVCIPVGPLYYEVGPDFQLAADTFRAKQLHDDYTKSPEYMALLRGALAMMKLPQIDLLVVGLPVALLALKKAALEKAMTGTHQLAGGRTITVRKALAFAQPQGALVHYAAEHEKMATCRAGGQTRACASAPAGSSVASSAWHHAVLPWLPSAGNGRRRCEMQSWSARSRPSSRKTAGPSLPGLIGSTGCHPVSWCWSS